MNEQQEPGFTPVTTGQEHISKKDTKSEVVASHDVPMPSIDPTISDGSTSTQTSALAVIALILGIIALLVPFFALPSLIVALFAMKQTSRGKQSGRGMAIAGLVMGILAMLEFIIGAIFFVFVMVASKNIDSTTTTSGYSSSTSSVASSTTTLKGAMKTPLTADKYVLTSNSVQHNFAGTKSYYVPSTGKEYVLVSVTVKNKDTYSHYFSSYDFSLRDSSGKEHTAMFMTNLPSELPYSSVATNGEITGNLVFEVPVSSSSLTLVYDPGYFSSQKAEIAL